MSPAAVCRASATSAPAPVDPDCAVAVVLAGVEDGALADDPDPQAQPTATREATASTCTRKRFMCPACPRRPEHRLTTYRAVPYGTGSRRAGLVARPSPGPLLTGSRSRPPKILPPWPPIQMGMP